MPRYDLSGRVTFQGEPVPVGHILFSPDEKQGNLGAATVADIQRGVYRTRPRKGAAAGAYRVTIVGTDESIPTEERDNSLFVPYHTRLVVDAGQTTFDFAVPDEVAAE